MKREIGLTVCVALAAGMAFGATVTTNGAGAVTIDVPADETYVYPAPLANDITSVTKTGAGIVKFSQAASGCTRPIDIQGGYADFTVPNAYGTGPINVASGAALVVSHASAGQSTIQVQGTVTIAGSGPQNDGALQFKGSAYADRMFNRVVLAADASWGGNRAGAVALDFAGYTLTWVGSTLMTLNGTWSNMGTLVHRGTADVCFQGGKFDAASAGKPLIVDGGSYVSSWDNSTPMPLALTAKNAMRLVGNWGRGTGFNIWAGPITIEEGVAFSLRSSFQSSIGAYATLRIAGPISGPGAVSNTYGHVYIDNANNAWTGGTYIGDGYTFFPAPETLPGWDSPGRVTISGLGALMTVAGAPIPGLNVQDTWTADEIRTMAQNMRIVQANHTMPGVGVYVTKGASFAYPYALITNFVKYGEGTLTMSGTWDGQPASFRVEQGTAILDGDADRSVASFYVRGERATCIHKTGTTTQNGMIRFSNSGRGVYRHLGGTYDQVGGDCYVSEAVNSYFSFELYGGTFKLNGYGNPHFARGKGGCAIFKQKGGQFNLKSSSFQLGESGDAVMYVAGGTNTMRYNATQGSECMRMGTAEYGSATLAITGSNTVFDADCLVVGTSHTPQTNVVSVMNGGTFLASRFYQASGDTWPFTNNFNVVSVDGGVMYPTFGWGWDHKGGSNDTRDFHEWVLHEHGMILDTSMCQNGDRTAAAPHDNPFNFCDATGKGFDSITLPTSGAFKQEVYLGPARIRIFDATGWGPRRLRISIPRRAR